MGRKLAKFKFSYSFNCSIRAEHKSVHLIPPYLNNPLWARSEHISRVKDEGITWQIVQLYNAQIHNDFEITQSV